MSELRPRGWAGVSQVEEGGKRYTEQPVQKCRGLGKQGVFREQRSSVWLELRPPGEKFARDKCQGDLRRDRIWYSGAI